MSGRSAAGAAELWTGLCTGRFLTVERVSLYGAYVIGAHVGVRAVSCALGAWLIGPDGAPIAIDFVAFWTARIVTATRGAAAFLFTLYAYV